MKRSIIALSLFTAFVLASCGSDNVSSKNSTVSDSATVSTSAETSEHATAPQNEVGYEGMTEVGADELKDGDYHISVDSSSSMFKIADCILHVNNGSMTADIIIASKSYDALFMGTEEEAQSADNTIKYTENEDGQSVFTVPVEALDKKTDCAALSAKKQEWYGRTLVFRADSLPDEAFNESRYETAGSIGLEDGEYTVEVTLDGGSGRASIESLTHMTVKDVKPVATITWSSDKYDQMVVDDETFLPTIADGHSIFDIDVIGFDYKMPVKAETTAMSEPYMIDYTLYFDSSTIEKCE